MDLKRHEIPTHLDVEDTLVLGLTVRQVLIILLGCAIGYSLWHALAPAHWPTVLRLVVSAILPFASVMLAILKPAGRPLELWVITWMRYQVLPRIYTWRPVVRDDGETTAARAESAINDELAISVKAEASDA